MTLPVRCAASRVGNSKSLSCTAGIADRGSRIAELTLFLLMAGVSAPTAAQRVEARIGVMAGTTLVHAEAASPALERALGNIITEATDLELRPAPVASVLLVLDLAPRTALEGSASAGLSKLRAANSESSWPGQTLTLAALGLGVRYHYHPSISINGGVGVTRFFSDSRGIFSQGGSANPLLEAGLRYRLPIKSAPLHLAARVQTHRFGTPALRREGASDGNATRFLLQLGVGR